MFKSTLKNGELLNIAGVGPSPSKDYYQLIVTLDEVIFRWWKVSLKKEIGRIAPGEARQSHENFIDNRRLQGDVNRVFGHAMFEYVMGLLHGRIDYLPRLPQTVLLKIAAFLRLEDIYCLEKVSKQFFEWCRNQELWEMLYCRRSEHSTVSKPLKELAANISWKTVYFMNRIQLQAQLRRLTDKQQQKKRCEATTSAADAVTVTTASLNTDESSTIIVEERLEFDGVPNEIIKPEVVGDSVNAVTDSNRVSANELACPNFEETHVNE